HPAFDNFPSVSPDGTQLLFFSNRDGGDKHMYIRNLNDDSPPVRVTDFPGMQGTHAKCWSPDGTQIVFTSDVGGKDRTYLMNIEPYRARQLIVDESADLQTPRISPDGKKLLYQARLADHSIEIRVFNTASTSAKVILKSNSDLPVTFLMSPQWSSDSTQIVFANKTAENSQVYMAKSDGSDLHPLTDGQYPDFNPTFAADGKEIFFSRDFYGMPKIYRMNIDGSEQRPLTSRDGYEMAPAISPDGHALLFSADRLDGRKMGLDIYLLDPSHPETETLLVSRPMHDASVVYSSDGKRIAFVAQSDDNPEIYVANADGSGMFRLTRNKASDVSPTFSADNKSVIFSSDRDGKYAIYEIDLPG
ncbi:MAG TPA: hypothetical protein VEV84_09245, partial [Pyrinomonadaceae bacterium]|nr:hypothetical protein [Pyrinomonadaceae bacterium]